MSELEEEVELQPVQSTSKTLVEAREKLGLSPKDVADSLYLTTTFIGYIDAGEFDKLPKPAFVKGYLRSYARLVGLSGNDIVAMYDAELQAVDPAPEIKGVTEEKVGTAAITGPVMQTGLIALIVFVLLVAGIWYMVSGSGAEDKAPASVTQPSVTRPSEEDLAEDFDYVMPSGDTGATSDPGAGSIEPQDPAVSPDSVPLSTESAPGPESAGTMAEASADADPGISPGEVTIERTSSGDRSFIKVDAGGFDQLELGFTGECWVEVEDGERGLVYSDMNRAGEVLTVYGTAPFTLLLGKASDVEMLYNGRPFDLEPYIGQDSTAKVTVSE